MVLVVFGGGPSIVIVVIVYRRIPGLLSKGRHAVMIIWSHNITITKEGSWSKSLTLGLT